MNRYWQANESQDAEINFCFYKAVGRESCHLFLAPNNNTIYGSINFGEILTRKGKVMQCSFDGISMYLIEIDNRLLKKLRNWSLKNVLI